MGKGPISGIFLRRPSTARVRGDRRDRPTDAESSSRKDAMCTNLWSGPVSGGFEEEAGGGSNGRGEA